MTELPSETVKRIRHSGFVHGIEALRENLMKIGKYKNDYFMIKVSDISKLVEKLEKEN